MGGACSGSYFNSHRIRCGGSGRGWHGTTAVVNENAVKSSLPYSFFSLSASTTSASSASDAELFLFQRIRNRNRRFASVKDTASIELFLKLAYQKSNREGALVTILTNDTARAHFFSFLEKEYYFDSGKDLCQEAVSFLNYEIKCHQDQTRSVQLDNVDTSRKQEIYQLKINGILDISRYNAVINELATSAFKTYLKSKMYKSWRAFESGSTASVRSRILVALSFSSRSAAPVAISASHVDDLDISCHGSRKSFCNGGWCEIPVDNCNVVDPIDDVQDFDAVAGGILGCHPADPQNPFNDEFQEDTTKICSEIDCYRGNSPHKSLPDRQLSICRTASCDGSFSVASSRMSSASSSSLQHQSLDSKSVPPDALMDALELSGSLDNERSIYSTRSGFKFDPPSIPRLLAQHSAVMPTASFAEAAFSSTSDNPQDMALLLGSTWLALLVSGVESISIGFCLLSISCKGGNRNGCYQKYPSFRDNLVDTLRSGIVLADVTDDEETMRRIIYRPVDDDGKQMDGCYGDRTDTFNEDFRFSYVNRQFERDFGYSKDELMGRTMSSLFCSTPTDNSYNGSDGNYSYYNAERALLRLLRSGASGHLALPLRRKNGRFTRTFLCTKALYDQRGLFRYVVCLTVNVPVNCGIMYRNQMLASNDTFLASTTSGCVSASSMSKNLEGKSVSGHQQVDIVTQFNSDALVELLDVLPTTFVDDVDASD